MRHYWEDSCETRLAAEAKTFIEDKDEIIFEEDKDAESQESYISNNPTALRLEIEKNY